MKPGVLATADRIAGDWPPRPRVLRFAPRARDRQGSARSPAWALAAAWLLILLVPLLLGCMVVASLDEPLLGLVAATLAMIPLLIGLCPRQRG